MTSNGSAEPEEEEEDEDLLPSGGNENLIAPHPLNEVTRKPKGACARSLETCPDRGCEDDGTGKALFNTLKRRATASDGSEITFASAVPVNFKVMADLQERAQDLIGQHRVPEPDERRKIASISVDHLDLGEGVGVRVVGYLAPHESSSSGVHEGAIESVNCRLGKEEQRDIHIPIIPKVGATECEGIVVEMMPQGRDAHPHWNAADLVEIGTDVQVMAVGPLFYDDEHSVHDDCDVKNGQPKRMSLWEVHPIVEFYKCGARSCSVDSLTGWIRVD